MNHWESIVSAALVGTGSRTPSIVGADPVLAPHLQAVHDDSIDLVLRTAALAHAGRLGQEPLPHAAELIPEAPGDPRPMMSDLAAGNVLRALDHSAELRSWCVAVVARSGLRPPPVLLAKLVQATQQDAHLWTDIATIVGPPGMWLADQVPEAHARLAAPAGAATTPLPPEDEWTHGHRSSRVAYLQSLRATDPAAGLRLLAAGWRSEPGPDRDELIVALSVGLGPGDEDFLEAALGDRRKGVRAGAQQLLTDLPESAFNQRLWAVASAAVVAERDGNILRRIDFHPILDPPGHLKRDGIDVARVKGRRAGESVVDQLLTRIPLTTWERHFDADAKSIVAAVPRADVRWVIPAWAKAAVAQGNRSWAEVLLGRRGADTKLAALVDADRASRFALELLARDSIEGVLALPTPWSVKVATAVIDYLAQHISRNRWMNAEGLVLISVLGDGLPVAEGDRWVDAVTRLRDRAEGTDMYPWLTEQAEGLRIRSVLLKELR